MYRAGVNVSQWWSCLVPAESSKQLTHSRLMDTRGVHSWWGVLAWWRDATWMLAVSQQTRNIYTGCNWAASWSLTWARWRAPISKWLRSTAQETDLVAQKLLRSGANQNSFSLPTCWTNRGDDIYTVLKVEILACRRIFNVEEGPADSIFIYTLKIGTKDCPKRF